MFHYIVALPNSSSTQTNLSATQVSTLICHFWLSKIIPSVINFKILSWKVKMNKTPIFRLLDRARAEAKCTEGIQFGSKNHNSNISTSCIERISSRGRDIQSHQAWKVQKGWTTTKSREPRQGARIKCLWSFEADGGEDAAANSHGELVLIWIRTCINLFDPESCLPRW